MKKIVTRDGSETYYNEELYESYHSTSGAAEEAIKKYAEPCRIANFDRVRILDVCFGLGYNSAAALDAFRGKLIEITALENDPAVLDAIYSLDPPFRSYGLIKEAAKNKLCCDGKAVLKIIMGDARESIKTLGAYDFDVVFFDPFSPKKCPELWTVGFFSDIYAAMKNGGVLATYSCAKSVRENLTKAGFEVRDGHCVGRRSPSTLAISRHKL
ncbi:hypothetical protein HZB03_00225 [Candidatus Woesearchaeota archaeon]|nr:hypothetical protein [Candidatus Woesearchaeota archaeon]